MNSYEYIFSQIMGLVPAAFIQTIVNRHSGDYKVKEFSCWKQFLCMAFGQLIERASRLSASGHAQTPKILWGIG